MLSLEHDNKNKAHNNACIPSRDLNVLVLILNFTLFEISLPASFGERLRNEAYIVHFITAYSIIAHFLLWHIIAVFINFQPFGVVNQLGYRLIYLHYKVEFALKVAAFKVFWKDNSLDGVASIIVVQL